MKKKQSNVLARALRGFFGEFLQNVRGVSPNTIFSYRDSIKLFLQFLNQQKQKRVSDLDIEDIGVEEVIAFLNYLEKNRGNAIGTRNDRLSALHSLFRYIGGQYPEYLYKSHRILNIPFKRMSTRPIDYLEFDEVTTLLKAVDRSKPYGRRDYALLSTMFNTGARAQEIVDLRGIDLQLTKPSSITIHGKGKKMRIVPIWPQTAQVLSDYVEEQDIDLHKPVPIFTNHLRTPLTRFGIRYILAKYVRITAVSHPSLKKKNIHPHSMRHSTILHLLKSGNDIITVGHWVGHCSPNTTNKYATIDLEMKRKALQKAKPLDSKTNSKALWRKDPNILEWLESL